MPWHGREKKPRYKSLTAVITLLELLYKVRQIKLAHEKIYMEVGT